MSRQGTGYVAVSTNTTTNSGTVIGTAVAGVVVGVGVLVSQGIMDVGNRLQERYENACKRQIDLKDQARAENLSQVSDLPTFMAQCVEQAASNSAHLRISPSTTFSHSSGNTETANHEIAAALAKARAALSTGQDIATLHAANELELWRQRVRLELLACQGLVPATLISMAETTLQQGTVAQLRQVLASLQQAANDLRDDQLRQQHAQRQATQALQSTTQQLQALVILLQNSGQISFYEHEVQECTMQLEVARREAASSPMQALTHANTIQNTLHQLMQTISHTLLRDWEATRLQIVTLQGTLDSLSTMLQEADSLNLAESAQLLPLQQRTADAQKDASDMLHATVPDLPQRLRLLTERTNLLKDDIFRITTYGQQKQIAQTIATTLAEQGFHSPDGQVAPIQVVGDSIQVVGMSTSTTSVGRRDDRVVTFGISRDGEVNYDFSGYVGDTCKPAIDRVFKALQDKGVFILDSHAAEEIQRLPLHQVTPATLRQPHLAPVNTPNKNQAEIAQRLLDVLQRMGYSNIQQNTTGGYIDLEAFNGSIGYHVVLPPEGSVQIFRDQQEITSDGQDPLAAEVQRVPLNNEDTLVQQERQKLRKTVRKPISEPRHRQMLDQ